MVIGSDVNGPSQLSNDEVILKSDVVIFSVPIKKTVKVIRSAIKRSKEGQLFIDVTSVKSPAIQAMLESKAQVVGLHPMFRPGVSFEGQTIVACPARLTTHHWKTWVVNVLAATKSDIKWSTAAKHDDVMLDVQVNPHLSTLVNALLMMQRGTSLSETLEYASPFYQVLLALMGRLVSQNPDLYASIAIENPGTLAMLERRIKIEQDLVRIIRDKDQASFEQLFVQAKDHFGSKSVNSANELFVRMLGVLETLYGKDSVTLEISTAESHPGLLERIARVFSRRHINLKGINSSYPSGNTLHFAISFELSRSSNQVRLALEEIQSWTDPKVKVLTADQ
jgi:prephenate dehydrogenase